jgi:hypothetical protein
VDFSARRGLAHRVSCWLGTLPLALNVPSGKNIEGNRSAEIIGVRARASDLDTVAELRRVVDLA